MEPVPWNPHGFFHADDIDPATRLDYHTGCVYAQDAASQVPVLMLDPGPGDVVIDVCAAPGSKSTQIGAAIGDTGLLVCCDASAPRRRVLTENLARQGIACALVTPLPLHRFAERHPGCADAVLVDAPCSGHCPRSAKQVTRMAATQVGLLGQAALLVRCGGRLVYSTCTPYRAEDEGVITAFLASHEEWSVDAATLPGCDADLAGLGGVRLWPQRQGTEPFFAIRLRRSGDEALRSLAGTSPIHDPLLSRWLPSPSLLAWRRGATLFAGSALVSTCALPSEARGIILGRGEGDALSLDAWGAQALIERGAVANTLAHADACRLWAGEAIGAVDGFVRSDAGAPLGVIANGRLLIPSRLRRAGLV